MTIIAFDGRDLVVDSQVSGETHNTSTIKIMPLERYPVAKAASEGKVLAMTGCGDGGTIMRIRQLVESLCSDGKTPVTGAIETIKAMQVTPISGATIIFLCKGEDDCPYVLYYDFDKSGEPYSNEESCVFGVIDYLPVWYVKSDRFCATGAVNFTSAHDDACGRGYSCYNFEDEELTVVKKTDLAMVKAVQADMKVILDVEMEID